MCFPFPALVLWAAIATSGGVEPAWRYVPDTTFRPVLRTMTLAAAKPDDLREDVTFRGKKRTYAQWRYGSADSRRVAIVIDEAGPDDWDLYVDADRNRVIEAKDKVSGSGRQRSLRLDLEITQGQAIRHEPRTVLLRVGTTRQSIGVATAGYMAGKVEIGGKSIAARRVDGDANGLFADAGDRVWLDLDGDGKWDPIAEQFPLLPILTLGKQRYAVRGDPLGTRLALEPLTAEGRIRVRLVGLSADATVDKLHVLLASDDGSAFGITSVDTPIVVPAGKYAISAVSLSVQQAQGVPIHYVFSRTGVDRPDRWYELKKDQELVLDPIGKLRFNVEIDQESLKPKAGATVNVQPQLFTADGLLINSCAHGEAELIGRHNAGRTSSVKLYDAQGKLLDTQTSGFA